VSQELRPLSGTVVPADAPAVGELRHVRSFGLVYGLYERRLGAPRGGRPLPQHVGVVLDGTRRWARRAGLESVKGYQAGAARIADLVRWCEELGINVVTRWMLSTDNLVRDEREVADLLEIIASVVGALARTHRWRLQMVGELDL